MSVTITNIINRYALLQNKAEDRDVMIQVCASTADPSAPRPSLCTL